MTDFENYVKSSLKVGNTKDCIRENNVITKELYHKDFAGMWQGDQFVIGWTTLGSDMPHNLVKEILRWRDYTYKSYKGSDRKEIKIKLAIASILGEVLFFDEDL